MENCWNVLMVGAGTMGRGIAEIFTSKGISITLYDAFPEQLPKAEKLVETDMQYYQEEGLITPEEIKNTRSLTSCEEDLERIAPKVNLMIEGVSGKIETKRDVFNKLDQLCPPDCIFCSDTSASNIFEIAQTKNPEHPPVAHSFNPPYVMPLVEVALGPKTSTETAEQVRQLLISVGKEPAVIKHYIPGFIISRLDNVLCREIEYMIKQGWTTTKDVERAIRYTSGTGYSFEGPLSLHDVAGRDLMNTISGDVYKTLCNDTGEDRFGKELVEKGNLGIKTGEGCCDYSGIDTPEFMNKRSHRIIKMLKTI